MLTHWSSFLDYMPKEGNFFHRIPTLDKSVAHITQTSKFSRDFESETYWSKIKLTEGSMLRQETPGQGSVLQEAPVQGR